MTTVTNGSGWSLREVARVAGRSQEHVAGLCRAGLLPERLATARVGAQLPEAVADALAAVFAAGAVTPRLAALMKDDPAQVLAAAEGLALLARRALAARGGAESEAA
ncbi:MAG: hypothetical protein GEU83_18775 [Pseudonocardiaceae bacterium]|nr:hypothetical protein [Pseudonocardiaceae bacterium]